MNVNLGVLVSRGSSRRFFKLPKTIPAYVQCLLHPASLNRGKGGPTRKKQFRVTGARMKVTKFNRDCPRRVGVRVTLNGNMDGRARYTLVRTRGRNQSRVMNVKWQGKKKYSGSFDHSFRVRRSRTIEIWIRHKRRAITARRRIRIDCSRPYQPKGVYVE